jgi:hypothetical protein
VQQGFEPQGLFALANSLAQLRGFLRSPLKRAALAILYRFGLSRPYAHWQWFSFGAELNSEIDRACGRRVQP